MRSKSKLLMISLCGAYLVGCDGSSSGGGSSISFEDLCNQGSSLMCEKASSCGYTGSKADCIAQGKALNCSGGPERYCGAGLTYQSSKAPACLDALNALTCSTLDASMPAACAPEVMCTSSSQGGEPTGTFRGEACQAVGVSNSCDPNASVCFAAGTASSCPNGALCVGDSKGMACAALCTVDADCTSAGAGLVCMQDCMVSILNGFCVKPSLKTDFLQYTCNGGPAPGLAGWSL